MHQDSKVNEQHGFQEHAVVDGSDADVSCDPGYDTNEPSNTDNIHAVADTEKAVALATSPESDNDTVSWDGPDDPANPLNWSAWKKFVNGALVSALALITPLASSFFAPGVPQLMQDFQNSSDLLAAFVISVYVLGFAFGPLIMAPMSEVYGRLVVYNICNIGFVVFMIACAVAPSLNALIVFRFLSGIFDSCPLANANGSIVDMVSQGKRASAIVSAAYRRIRPPAVD